MEYRKLGSTDVDVSVICLGTMTYGEQNSEREAHEQLEYAIAHGINFIDTAEMYPVPPKEETQGLTEKFIGSWLINSGRRDQVIIASKVAGPGMMPYLRGGPQLTKAHINQALEDSLRRLQTDYIDLYQIHWPARNTNYFGKLGYAHQEESNTALIEDIYECLVKAVEAGKVRYLGISNETPWGAMQYQMIAHKNSWPSIVSIQNPYSLLNRTYEIGLSEISHREKMGLLAYSPLGFGVLTGKYLNGQRPANARLTLYERFDRYTNPQAEQAVHTYTNIAMQHGCSVTQMSLAYVNTRSFLTSNIIGATSMQQLKENIESIHIDLSDEILELIEETHITNPNPCP